MSFEKNTQINRGSIIDQVHHQAHSNGLAQHFHCCHADVFPYEPCSRRSVRCGKSISKAAQEALAAKYGLDKPLFEQYITYITDFIKGDMGVSLRQRGRTVSDIIFLNSPYRQNSPE